MKKTLIGFILAVVGFCYADPVVNGSFEQGLTGWSYGKHWKTDASEKAEGKQSLKMEASAPCWDRVWQMVSLEPDSEYELTYYMKCENVTGGSPKKGVYLYIKGVDKKLLGWGMKKWKAATGSFDWKKFQFRFNTKDLGNPKENELRIQMQPEGTGTFWIDGISLKKVSSPVANLFRLELFPVDFQSSPHLKVCGNLPAMVNLLSHGARVPAETRMKLEFDVPQFLRISSFCESPNGLVKDLQGFVKETAIEREGQTRRKYEITLPPSVGRWSGQRWYQHLLVFEAQPGAAGKKCRVFWRGTFGREIQAEKSFAVEILPDVPRPEQSCKRFGLFSTRTLSRFLPGENGMKFSAFWDSLSEKKLRMVRDSAEGDKKNYPGWETAEALWGNVSKSRFNQAMLNDLQKKFPVDLQSDGRTQSRYGIPIWAMVDDPKKEYEKYFRESMRQLRRAVPDLKILFWDFEPMLLHGFGPEGLRRFAEKEKLGRVPSPAEINGTLNRRFWTYMLHLHRELAEKNFRMIREELPGVQIHLCSDNLLAKPPHVSYWCCFDVSTVDHLVDVHQHMVYYCGIRYFDDIAYNIKTLKKPFYPILDPAERQIGFFRRYTPSEVMQNVVATAALGGTGIGFWPDDAFDGAYYPALRHAFDTVARNEDFYFDGQRCDKEITVTPKNAIFRKISAERTISQPDFSAVLRYTAHRLNGKTLVTLFNYSEKNAVIAEIAGKDFSPMLVKVQPDHFAIVRSDERPDQKPLQKEIARFRGSPELFRDYVGEDASVKWGADADGLPVLTMTNANGVAAVNALGACELVSLRKKDSDNLLSGGFAGKLEFHDRLQPALTFKLEKHGIGPNGPFLEVSAVVGPYEGANPSPNPLMDMRITRRFELKNNTVTVSLTFSNPTKMSMPMAVRINNLSFPGKRFGAATLVLRTGDKTVEENSPTDVLFFRSGQPSFLKQIPAFFWDGSKVELTGKNGTLTEKIIFDSLADFAGVYSWTRKGIGHYKTVELILSEKELQPGESRTFRYRIVF